MDRLPKECYTTIRRIGIQPTENVLAVSIHEQRLHWFQTESPLTAFQSDSYQHFRTLICSTSKFGIGQQENSNCTPLGLHTIRERIGDGCLAGTVFKGRKAIGHTSQGMPNATITTRILWLAGLEAGYNQGGEVDSHDRYIYIHGTSDFQSLGKPASHGCVHLADDDLVFLFDQAPSGTLVWIQE